MQTGSTDRGGTPLAQAFTRARLLQLAGHRSFERGMRYARDGQVRSVQVSPRSARGVVLGGAPYRVSVRLGPGGEPDWSCSCPQGDEGAFCKHCVALVTVAATLAPTAADLEPEPAPDLPSHLRSLPPETLVELLLELAARDPHVDAKLRLHAAAAAGNSGTVPVNSYRVALDQAFDTDDHVSYREARGWAERVMETVEALDELVGAGHGAAAMGLAEEALARTEAAVQYVDDSDGWLTEIAERLGEVHLAATTEARPAPEELARHLFELELGEETFGVFSGAAATYGDVLGEQGLAVYRQLAQSAWRGLRQLEPGDDRYAYGTRRLRITAMMESLAALSNDVEELVAVLARDLSSAWQYARIVDAYRDAQRHDDALTWAERGVDAHGTRDSRLVEVLAATYHQTGRDDDAVRLRWRAFDDQPTFATYQRLRDQAREGGSWASWRDRALERLADEASSTGRGGDELVRVLLGEGEVDSAWAAAERYGVHRGLQLELARAREQDHPEDVVALYQEEVEHLVAAKDNRAYQAAVDLLAHLGDVLAAAGRGDEWAPYVAEVRARHKPKRNLMKLFDHRRW